MEPRSAVEAHNGGVETQNGIVEGLYAVVAALHHFNEKDPARDPDPHQSERSQADPQHWYIH
jgi:hypothetical protein